MHVYKELITQCTSWSGNGTANNLQVHGKDDVVYDPLLVGSSALAKVCPEDGAILPVGPKHKTGKHRHAKRVIDVLMRIAHNQFSAVSVNPDALQSMQSSIDPVNSESLVIECNTIGPNDVIIYENESLGTIHIRSFYLSQAPVRPEHETVCMRVQK